MWGFVIIPKTLRWINRSESGNTGGTTFQTSVRQKQLLVLEGFCVSDQNLSLRDGEQCDLFLCHFVSMKTLHISGSQLEGCGPFPENVSFNIRVQVKDMK